MISIIAQDGFLVVMSQGSRIVEKSESLVLTLGHLTPVTIYEGFNCGDAKEKFFNWLKKNNAGVFDFRGLQK